MLSRKQLPLLTLILALLAIGLFVGLMVEMNPTPAYERDFDYVIIGSGAGGATVAEYLTRLAPQYTVLVLEAGPDQDENPLVTEVINSGGLLSPPHISELFWGQIKTFEQPVEPPAAISNLLYTGGRCRGGSTSINGMQFVRGTNWMAQRWENLTGDPIWGAANATDVYIDLEDYLGTSDFPANRGSSGRLTVSEMFMTAPQTTPTSMSLKLVEGISRASGLPPLADYNNMEDSGQIGPFAAWQMTAFTNGTRCSSSRAFLGPDVLARANMRLIDHAQALRIHFSGKRATQVSYLREGEARAANARKRVILAAGINSPQILQTSGVGPGGSVVDNPNVGRFLYNHQGLVAVFLKNTSDAPSANINDIYEGGAWLPSALNTTDQSPRMFQLIGINSGAVMVVVFFHIQPNASGYVHPFDNDPLRMPNVSDNTFGSSPGDTIDLDEMTAGVKKYICGLYDEFQGTAGHGAAIDTDYVVITPTVAQCANDTLLRAFVQESTIVTAHHWVASNRMGRCGDGVAVANSKGSVCGTTGLTVADASLVPHSADGNTQAPAYRVGLTLAPEILAGRF